MVLASLVLAGIGVGALVLRPRRVELVHSEARETSAGRVLRVGRWTQADGWIGRSRYVIELVGHDNRLHKIHPLIYELEPAIELMNLELDKLDHARGPRPGDPT